MLSSLLKKKIESPNLTVSASHRDTTNDDILRLLVAAVVPSLTALKPWELGQLIGSLS